MLSPLSLFPRIRLATFPHLISAALVAGLTSTATGAATSGASIVQDNGNGTVQAWIPIAKDYNSATVPGTQQVRYGAGNKWIYQSVTGSFTCSQRAFGGNPAPNWPRSCEVLTTVAAPEPVPSNSPTGGPPVDTDQTWYGLYGYDYVRVERFNEMPSNAGGAFRMTCDPSHMSFDDPLVYPGQPGRSHLHYFFGNTDTDANSTPAKLVSSGRSTCKGGIADRSAYWVPAMIDTSTDTPIRPLASMFYYKNGYWGIDPKTIQNMPAGLRMLAGAASNATPEGPYIYRCIGGSTNGRSGMEIPNCANGTTLRMELYFPECWDGQNLDSPDHKSHMAYRSGPTCPASHPVPIAKMSFLIDYPVTSSNTAKTWRLASDMYSTSRPGGYSAHGDFMDGWAPRAMDSFMTDCNRANKDCHAHLIGNRWRMY